MGRCSVSSLPRLAGRSLQLDPVIRAERSFPGLARRLFTMGLVTNLLSPKIAVLYVSLLPQFVDSDRAPVLPQFLTLGLAQIAVSLAVNAVIVAMAGTLAAFLARRPGWLRFQRWFMATVLGVLTARLALQPTRP